jgi:hypothetical protein
VWVLDPDRDMYSIGFYDINSSKHAHFWIQRRFQKRNGRCATVSEAACNGRGRWLREKDDDVRAFVWNRRGVVGSLERGSSEVFYWEFVCFSRRPFIYSHRRF